MQNLIDIGCIVLKHVEVSQELASFVAVGQMMNIHCILGCEEREKISCVYRVLSVDNTGFKVRVVLIQE